LSPDIISFSIGTNSSCDGFCDSNLVANLCDDAFIDDIFVLAAAGNDDSIGLVSPACGSNVFSVGSTTDNDEISNFSNIYPTLDMFAPGENITTAAGSGSGTSYSTPHVAGAAALVLENEKLSPIELKNRFRTTGKSIFYSYNNTLNINISRLDLYNAIIDNKTMQPYNYSNWWQDEIDEKIYGTKDGTYGNTGVESKDLPIGSYKSRTQYEYQSALRFTCTEDCTVTNIIAYVENTHARSTLDTKCAIYTADGAARRGELILVTNGETGEVSIPASSSYSWRTYTFSTNPELETDKVYYLCIYGEAPPAELVEGTTNIASDDDGASTTLGELCNAYPTFEEPWVGYTTDTSSELSIYCSYVSDASNTAPNITGHAPTNGSNYIDPFTSVGVSVGDDDGDQCTVKWYWGYDDSCPYYFGETIDVLNESVSKSNINFSEYDQLYYWNVTVDDGNDTTNSSIYHFRTRPLELNETVTNSSSYNPGNTVKFTGKVAAGLGDTVALIIASNISNLNKCTYHNRSSSIASSDNRTINVEDELKIDIDGWIQISATMAAVSSTTWYAKLCNITGESVFLLDNITAWNKTYASTDQNDIPYSATTDSDDNVYIAGLGDELNGSTNNDFWIMKFDKEGNRLWNETYNGGIGSGSGSNEFLYEVTTDLEDNVYIAGAGVSLNGSGITGSYDWWIMKFDIDGNRLWNKTYADGSTSSNMANSVATDSNNNAYIVGYGTNLNGTTKHTTLQQHQTAQQ